MLHYFKWDQELLWGKQPEQMQVQKKNKSLQKIWREESLEFMRAQEAKNDGFLEASSSLPSFILFVT